MKGFMYCVWYKKVLTFTEEELCGNRILFHIGAADFDTKVWVGGKQCMAYKSHGCYYTRTTGIWQTVWYEIVPEAYIKYAKLTPDLSNCSVSVGVELRQGNAQL